MYDELLLEKLNSACACELEIQNKRRMLTSRTAAIHSAQTDTHPVKKEKLTHLENIKMQPDVLSELKEMRSNMALLHDLNAEVSQIKEYMQQPQTSPVQHFSQTDGLPSITPAATHLSPSQVSQQGVLQGPPQAQWLVPGYGQQGSHNQYSSMPPT